MHTLQVLGGIGLAIGAYVAMRRTIIPQLSPDGIYYQQMARHQGAPMPYNQRWLLPLLLGAEPKVWEVLSALALIVSAALLAAGSRHPLVAVALFIGLPGLFWIHTALPVLTDAPAFALALASAYAFAHGAAPLGLTFGILAAGCKEPALLFVGLWLADPQIIAAGGVLLLGTRVVAKPFALPPDQPWLVHPITAARWMHDWRDWRTMLLPWGALAVLTPYYGVNAAIVGSLGVGYAQLIVAQDTARLYQWAAPPLIWAAAAHPATGWVAVLVVLHWFNPYRGV